jgi:integrase/recombinase XerD
LVGQRGEDAREQCPRRQSLYGCRQRKYLTAAERSRFVNAAVTCRRAELRALCLMLVYTGCRISEALAITPKAIERQAGFIAIRSLKKRNRAVMIREVPVPADLFHALDEAHDAEERDTLLWPLSRTRAWQLVKDIMREAAVPEGPHMRPRGYGIASGFTRSGPAFRSTSFSGGSATPA